MKTLAKIGLGICIILAMSSVASAVEEPPQFLWKIPAQQWYIGRPQDVAIGPLGNVYVADDYNDCIHKFTSDGVLIAKWGSYGSGDSQFENPDGIAVDSDGDVYVSDTDNHRIQKFTSDGVLITKWGSYGSGDSQFDNPHGIAVDSYGDVYVADYDNHRIQKFTSEGVLITKWGSSGSGNGQFRYPTDIAIGPQGDVYVADRSNHRIQKFTSDGGFITKWGSPGSGSGQFNALFGIAVDSQGDVYTTDPSNNRIQKFTSTDGINYTFVARWGGKSWIGCHPQNITPHGIAVDPDDGNVYVADVYRRFIRKFSPDLVFIIAWGNGGTGDGRFLNPFQIAVDSYDGSVYVVDYHNNRIQKFTSDGVFIRKWGSFGSGDGQFNALFGIAVGPYGNIYVAESHNQRVQKFTSDGVLIGWWGRDNTGYTGWHDPGSGRRGITGSGDGQFCWPGGVAVNPIDGSVYVADMWNNRIQKFTSDGEFITKWGSRGTGDGQFGGLYDIAVDPNDGNVYVADGQNHRIQKFTSDGEFITKWGSYGSGDGQFRIPYDVPVDPNDGSVYVVDYYNHRIQKFTSDGVFITKWGSLGTGDGQFSGPCGIAVGSLGDVYVVDYSNHRIQKFGKPSDVTPPVITCPDDYILEADENCQVTYSGPPATAEDETDPNPIITSDPELPATFAGVGDYTITWTATDASGNTSSCDQTITVQDVTPPVITCPSDAILIATGDDCEATYSGPSATAADNCDASPTITSDPPLSAPFPVGVNSIIYTATDASENEASCTQTVTVVKVSVYVDIKPGSCPNPINLKSKGVLPVAVLGTAEFDIAGIDVSTVELGSVKPIRSSVEDVATPYDGEEFCGCTEEEGDGYADLTLKFETEEIVEALGGWDELTDGQKVELTLTANLDNTGTCLEGQDCVLIKKKPRGGPAMVVTGSSAPIVFGLSQNNPNPFARETSISYTLPASGYTTLKIYDTSGRLVTTLVDTELNAGIYSITWNRKNAASGIYFYRLTSGGRSMTRAMTVIR